MYGAIPHGRVPPVVFRHNRPVNSGQVATDIQR